MHGSERVSRRAHAHVLACQLTIALLAVACVVLGGGGLLAQMPQTHAQPTWPKAAFRLNIQSGKRYLVDSAGTPLLIHGDAASLIAQSTPRGCGKISAGSALAWLQHSSDQPDRTSILDQTPGQHLRPSAFPHGGRFRYAQRDYFAHSDQVPRMAAENGILVLLAPAYIGYRGGP
jgi:hypothetical protein